jgi:hypothetical protein
MLYFWVVYILKIVDNMETNYEVGRTRYVILPRQNAQWYSRVFSLCVKGYSSMPPWDLLVNPMGFNAAGMLYEKELYLRY